MKFTLRAFRHRNFRLFFSGQSLSLVGTWVQHVAMSWLVYRLTGSPLMLGLTGFAGQIPVLLFAPLGGIWSDRAELRQLLLATQIAAMLQAAVLAALTFTEAVQVWHVIGLAVLLGIVNAFDTPVRQAFLVELVGSREDLPNAIALNSFMMNAGRMIGPSVAGILISVSSEAVCFLVNALSFLAVIVAVLLMEKPPGRTQRGAPPAVLQGLKEGIAYAWGFAPIRALLGFIALVSFMATPYAVLMPIYAAEVFGGGPDTLGFMVGSAGLGALSGTLFLASRKSVRGLLKVIATACGAAGVALMLFAYSGSFWLSVPLLVVTGFGIIVTAAAVNQIVQTLVDDDKRGRVMGLYTMAFLGVAPLGSLAGGSLAQAIGAAHTLFIGGAFCLAGALWLVWQRRILGKDIRPVYDRMGIPLD
ncbi:MAG: MFS transporter [Betaproteobacteria bacterium]|nr:MFS transporter [Betaproteobacteria bacterium]